ncbi:MAG: hypothetical protein JSV33_01830 [bacterium]|nr:MAG: hypothetical protein JSV33_01830 [bacterium]
MLTDVSGDAVPDGSYSITFNIYDQEVGGTALWTETNTVQVTKGIFNVVLGTLDTLDIAFDEPYWMGMSVEGEAELTPRVELTASAYSFNSRSVTGTDNVFPPSGNVGIGTIAPNRPLTITGPSDVQVGLQFNGNNSSYSSIYVNSNVGFARPGFGYVRGGLKAHTFLDVGDNWVLRVGSTNALSVLPSGNVGIGVAGPTEILSLDGAINVGGAAGTTAGTIQWTGSDFEGYNGSTWQSLTGGAGGSLPVGTSGQTLRHDGASWAATSALINNGTDIGIGTASPVSNLHIYENVDGWMGIRIQNPNTGSGSAESIDFVDENGGLAGIRIYDDDNPTYGAHMAIFNNRPSGVINLRTGGVNRVLLTEDGNLAVGLNNPVERLDVNGGIRVGSAAGTNSGTIQWTGTDFEGYDGSSWKSLTGSGPPAGTQGQTLRHNGTDWIATSNLYNNGTAIGLGTVGPQWNLHVYKNANNAIGIGIQNPNAGNTAAEYLSFRGSSGDIAALAAFGSGHIAYPNEMHLFNNRPGGLLSLMSGSSSITILESGGIGVNKKNPATTLDVAGSIRAEDTLFAPVADISSYDASGRLRLLRSGMSGGSVALDAQAITDGAIVRLYDEGGGLTHYIDADGDGEGGYFAVMRDDAGNSGLIVDGNRNGTLSGFLGVWGPSRSAALDMSNSGNNCVVLPADAISASEIQNEAGGGGANSLDASGIALTPAVYDVLASRSITVSTAGYVLVTSACQLTIDHASGAMTYADVGVSDVNNAFVTSTDMTAAIADAAPTGRYIIPASSTALFTVSAGTHTFYMLGRGGAGTVTAYDVNLAAVFIPTAYGTVSPTLTSASDGIEEGTTRAMSSSDIAAERSESIAINQARIERELLEMKAKIEELEKELQNK